MRPGHLALGVLVAVIWGFAFVATKIALENFTAPELTALRFLVAALPAVVVPRPPLPWSVMAPIGLTLFAGRFLFQFFGIASGMPAGLAAVTVQMQAFFTVVFAAVVLRERPSRREAAGMTIGLAGVAVIAATVGGDLTVTGLGLTLAAAVSWGVGNVQRGTSIPTTLTLKNTTSETHTVTRGAVSLHTGALRVVGPRTIDLTETVGATSNVSRAVDVLVPPDARPGSFLTLAIGVLGQVGADPKRRLLGTDQCVVEIVR